MSRKQVPIIDRLIPRLVFGDNWYDDGVTRTRCLLFTGYRRKGYGIISGKSAHRVMYEHWADPILDGMQLDHQCHNASQTCSGGINCIHRSCVNPLHLEPTDARTNVLRGRTIPARNRVKTHCPRGHEYTLENTYFGKRGRECHQCRRLLIAAWQERNHERERLRIERRSAAARAARRAAKEARAISPKTVEEEEG